jgi:hypothetical protein
MADPKQLKFQFVVDEASLQKTRQLIRELTGDLAKLNEAAQKAGGGAGALGGLNVGGGGDRSPENQRVIAKTSPIARPLVQNMLDQKNVFKTIADGSSASLRTMTRDVQSAVDSQVQKIERLKNKINELSFAYGRMDETGRKAARESISKLQGRLEQREGLRDELLSAGRQAGVLPPPIPRRELLPGIGPPGADMPGPMAGPGAWQRFKGFMTADRNIPGLSTVMGKNTVMGTLAGRFGITPGMVGSAGLAAVGAWGVKNIANQVWDAPNQFLRSEAEMGQMLGQRSLDIRSGEFRNMSAQQSILRDANKRKDYQDLNSGWRRFVHGTKAFIGGDFNEAFSGRAADLAVAKKQQEQVAMERESNPLMDQLQGEFQNYQQTLSTARAFHVGTPKGGGSILQQIYKIRQSFPGFSDGEIAGALGQLSSAGTRGGAWSLVGNVLHGEAAGIQGLGSSAGIMSRFGARRGPGGRVITQGTPFAETLRSYVGGGMDATSAGLAGQYVAGQQAQLGMNLGARPGDFQGSGLMDMITAGTAGIGGRVNMDQNIRGAEYLQRTATGQSSPYQAARNVMMAMEAAPGMNMYGTSYMARKMSLTELADAASGKGGDVNAVFKALGGSKEAAGKYFKSHTKSLLEGVSAEGLGDTSAGKMARAMADSGMDPREFFKKNKGKWGKILGKGSTEEDALAAYAGALQASDENLDAATALGAARDITGAGGKAKKGGKAGAPGGGSQEMELAREHLKALTTQVQSATTAFNEVTQSVKNLALRARLESEGVDMKSGDSAMRERRERVLMALPHDATRQQYQEKMSEFELMDRVQGMKSDTDRVSALAGAGVKDPTNWMRQHKVGGWR